MRSAPVRHPFVPFDPFDPFDLAVTRNPKHCPLAKPGCATQAICCREAQCGSPFLDYVLPPERARRRQDGGFPSQCFTPVEFMRASTNWESRRPGGATARRRRYIAYHRCEAL